MTIIWRICYIRKIRSNFYGRLRVSHICASRRTLVTMYIASWLIMFLWNISKTCFDFRKNNITTHQQQITGIRGLCPEHNEHNQHNDLKYVSLCLGNISICNIPLTQWNVNVFWLILHIILIVLGEYSNVKCHFNTLKFSLC